LNVYPINGSFAADEEPDEFDFNFLGDSGKFFLDQTGAWVVQSDKPLKVVFNTSDFIMPFLASFPPYDGNWVTKAFSKFTIIDEKGNQYVFGGNENAIEYSNGMIDWTNGEQITANSWFLTQVISADGSETMNLTYERGPFVSNITSWVVEAGYSGIS